MIITLYTYSPKDQRWFYLNGIALWSTAPCVVTRKWCVLDSDTEVAIIGFLFGWVTNTRCHPPRGWIRRVIHRLVFGVLYNDTHILQYIPRNMHAVFALLCFVVVVHWLIFPYPSGLLHWHCGNRAIAPVPAKQPWWIWINTSCEFAMNDCITTTKQSTTKPCAYLLGYTVQQNTMQWGFARPMGCSMTLATPTIDIECIIPEIIYQQKNFNYHIHNSTLLGLMLYKCVSAPRHDAKSMLVHQL